MKKWTVQVTMEVADSWVADGFNLGELVKDETVNGLFTGLLSYAYGHEVNATSRVIRAPKKEVIDGLQNGDVAPKD